MQTLHVPKPPSVRDFAYAVDHPLHYGVDGHVEDALTGGSDDEIPWGNNNYEEGEGEGEEEAAKQNQDKKQSSQSDARDSSKIQGKAIALFDFVPENDNEFALKEGQIIWISYRHGQGWLVATGYDEDNGDEIINNGHSGLVPEEYVQLIDQ